MTEDERLHIEQEIAHLKHDRRFFSNAGKHGRERLSCAMFLRALGLRFSDEELIADPNDGPPDHIDVKFRAVGFQVVEVLDEDCHRQDDVKAQLRRYEEALQDWRSVSFRDVVEPSHRPMWYPMSYSEIYARLSEVLAKKAFRYDEKARALLDALGCIQLTSMHLDPASPLPDETTFRQRGWRSVSFIMSMSSHVVYATAAAPTFL